MKKLIIIILLSITLPFPAIAATGWMDDNGAASWSNCQGATPLSGTAACSQSTVEANASAGDIIYIRAGTYTSTLDPANDGSGYGSEIIFEVYDGETVTFSPTSGDCVGFNESVWLVLRLGDGTSLNLSDPGATGGWIGLEDASHFVIDGVTATGSVNLDAGYAGVRTTTSTNDGVIINSVFGSECEPNDGITLQGDRNFIGGNSFGKSPHQNLNTRGHAEYNVIKGNVFENPYHTAIATSLQNNKFNLIEGNTISNIAADCLLNDCFANVCGSDPDRNADSYKHGGLQANGPLEGNIYRWNNVSSDGAAARTMALRAYQLSGIKYGTDVYNHRIYQNTLANACLGLLLTDDPVVDNRDNKFLNNIFDIDINSGCGADWNYRILATPNGGSNDFDTNIMHGNAPIRYRSHSNVTVATINSTYSEWSNNVDSDPLLDASFKIQVGSPAIDAGRYHFKAVGAGSSSTSLVSDDPYMVFTTGPPWNLVAPVTDYAVDDTIYNATADWSTTVTAINHSTGVLTLASAQTWSGDDEFYVLRNGAMYAGAAPDIGEYEYDGGTPTVDPAEYDFVADGSDNYGNHNLACADGDCTYAGGGIVINDNNDGHLEGTAEDNIQITEIVCLELDENTGTTDYVIGGRWNIPGGKNSLITIDRYDDGVGAFKTLIGYNMGASSEEYVHGYTVPTSTKVCYAHAIDGTNKLLNQYVMDTDGNALGSDVENTAILSARTFNYAESGFWIGARGANGERYDGLYPHGRIYYYYRTGGILPRASIAAIVIEEGGGGAPDSPTVDSNYWSNSSGPALTADQQINQAGQEFCHTILWSEAAYSTGGPAVAADQIKIATNAPPPGITLDLEQSTHGTNTWVFCADSEAGQRFGALQLGSTDPISLGTADIVDSQSNAFDKDGASGLDIALTYTPVFQVETTPQMKSSSNSGAVNQTSSGQPIK